jgi:hypothetical protein
MSTKQIVSKRFNVTTALDFVDDVAMGSAYYVFAAKHTPYEGGETPIPTPNDAVVNNYINIYNDMLFGKRVANTDIKPMIPRYDWTAGTTYAMYDDTDAVLHTKQFYATVNAGAEYHVYKCLFNDYSTASTVEPSGTDNDTFETSDGYLWKYMYSANNTIMSKFATTEYMPVAANAAVTANATPGSIEVIKVEDGGVGYANYLVAHFEKAEDIRVLGDEYRYALGSTASTIPDFYKNCLLRVTSGDAKDEYRVITAYTVGAQKIAVVDDPFDGVIDVNDTFEVYPFVDVFDTGGTKIANCIARAIVSGVSSNAITKVEVMDPGSGYKSAIAIIRPADTVGVTAAASLRAIMSPPDGHGANCFSELGANYAGVAVKFIENEGVNPELRTENDYRQVGLLRNPLFANVEISYSSGNTIGNFLPDERVSQYTSIRLAGTANTFSDSTIRGVGTIFQDSLSVGDRLLVSDGLSNIYGNVVSIVSNTHLTIDANASFTSQGCLISLVNASAYGIISASSTGVIYVANVNVSNVSSSLKFIGEESFCTTIADTDEGIPQIKISRGGSTPDVRVTNNFSTFSQLTKFAGKIVGTFEQDELVTQSSAVAPYDTPSARLYAAVDDTTVANSDFLYVTNVLNTWGTNKVATGDSSEAQFTVEAKYEGELVPGSGEVVYIENLAPIQRSNNQTETIKLILEF